MAFAIYIANDGAPTTVTAATSDGILLPANQGRKGGIVYNDSTATLCLLLSGNTVSSTSVFTTLLGSGTYFQIPPHYIGVVRGNWTAASGNARITELL